MTFETALLAVLADVATYSRSEAWETCLACGCLCKPDETCPSCTATRLVNST